MSRAHARPPATYIKLVISKLNQQLEQKRCMTLASRRSYLSTYGSDRRTFSCGATPPRRVQSRGRRSGRRAPPPLSCRGHVVSPRPGVSFHSGWLPCLRPPRMIPVDGPHSSQAVTSVAAGNGPALIMQTPAPTMARFAAEIVTSQIAFEQLQKNCHKISILSANDANSDLIRTNDMFGYDRRP